MSVLDEIAAATTSVRVPTRYDRVFKTECMFSFDSPETPTGLYTSLTTWQSFSEDFVANDYQRNSNPLYLKQIWKRLIRPEDMDIDPMNKSTITTKTEKNVNSTATNAPPSKLAIGVDGGFDLNTPRYDKHVINSIVVFPSKLELILPSDKLPESVQKSVDAILAHDGHERAAAVAEAAWEEEERKESKYAKTLIQLPSEGKKISPDPKTWVCEESGLRENLWLNLSTGHIGSGRRNWDGSGGTGAAKRHFEETGKKYPLVVKLGTITAQGADVFSYADDEDDMVLDPYLSKHLAHWGINMQLQEKSEKTVTELQIEFNTNYNFSKITESGADLQPLHGPGYIGLENLGNSCYMSSMMQIMFSIPQIATRYASAQHVRNIFESAPVDPSEDLLTMTAKLGCSLLSDKYASRIPIYEKGPDGTVVPSTKEVDENEEYGSIKPTMFKSIIGKNHPEFSSGRQQDVSEFFQHFLDRIARAERAGRQRLLSSSLLQSDNTTTDNNCSFISLPALFGFELEDRIEDKQTGKVKYVTREDNLLSLAIDVNDAVNKQQYDDYTAQQKSMKRPKYEDGSGEFPVQLDVPLDSCLERYASAETIDHFISPDTGRSGQASKRTRFKTFPEYLAVHLKRYYLDDNWLPKKLDASVAMPMQLNLEHLRAKGQQPGEVLMAENNDVNNTSNGISPIDPTQEREQDEVIPDASIVRQLMDMGFSENGSKRAAIATNNSSAQASMEWVFEHMSDPNFNDPIEQTKPSTTTTTTTATPSSTDNNVTTSRPGPSAETLSTLTSMGFTDVQAKAALLAVDGSLERAADWLFSHADGLDAAVNQVMQEADAEEQNRQAAVSDIKHVDGEAKYELLGFASHLGNNTSCGHYVAHIMKEGIFVLFNDAKVAVSKRPPTDLGFLYIYKRKH